MNLRGEMIGINTAIISSSGGNEGIGFAIPSNMALHVVKALIAHGKVERGWLGVNAQDLTPDLAKSFGLESFKGALIAEVTKNGPADQAGIKQGDVVLVFNGKEITDASTLRNEVGNKRIGEEVKMIVWRGKERKEIMVTIGNLEELIKTEKASLKERLGGEFKSVGPKEVEKYSLGSSSGVVITWLDSKGPLAKAGFEVGDMILVINDQNIDGLESFGALINTIPPHQSVRVLALDHRTGETGYVPLEVR